MTFSTASFADEKALLEENQKLKVRITELERELEDLRAARSPSEKPEDAKLTSEVSPLRKFIQRADRSFEAPRENRWLQIQYQFDTRAFNTLNVEGAAPLPLGLSVWGFIDINSPDRARASRIDLEQFFMEIDVKREVWKGFGPLVELNDADGPGNNVGRFGIFYEPHWNLLKKSDLWLFTKWFPLGTNKGSRQGSFAWNWAPKRILDGRFSTGGFFDLNFAESGGDYRSQIVSETIFRYRLLGNLHATLEYKYNEFLVKDHETGWAIGVQYIFQ